MTPGEFSIVIGDQAGHHLAAQATFVDSVTIQVSNGVTYMGRRLWPEDMRRLAEYLTRWADRLDSASEPTSEPTSEGTARA